MYCPTFDELVGDERTFFQTYFGRRALLRKNALRSPAAELLSVADLDDILASEAIRPPYVRVTRQGQFVRESTYTRAIRVQDETVTDSVHPERIEGHFAHGATITWNSMNQFRPNLRALTALLSAKFATRSDVVAFVTPAGRPGFTPHVDPVDVFVIQTHGVKAWQVWPIREPRPRELGYNVEPTEMGEPLIETVLEPGDVLYVPHGAPHVAVCEQTMSMHLSVSVLPRRWSDVVREAVTAMLDADERFADFPAWTHADPAELRGVHKELLALVADGLARLDGADLLPAAAAGEGSTTRRVFQRAAQIDALTAESLVRIHRAEVTEAGEGMVRVALNGNVYAMPALVREIIDRAPGPVPVGALVAGSAASECVEIAKRLARIGVLDVSRP